MKDRIAAIIAEYDAQGIHRTGTEVDNASAEWMAATIRAINLVPDLDEFAFERVEVHEARLEVDGVVIAGVPLYDCTYTGADGIVGTTGEVGSHADIGIMMAGPFAVGDSARTLLQARRAGTHQAIVVVTDERLPATGVATLNAEDFANPFGPPVLQIPNAQWQRIQGAMARGARANFVAHASYVPATARNIQARIPGQNASLPPLVIMTPRSGWWHCASERGGGLAAYFEMMRALERQGPHRDVIFTANTGHELGHTGLDHFLELNPGLIREAAMWIHLGANFAARWGAGVRLQYVDEPSRRRVAGHLQQQGLKPVAETPVGERPLGEARNIFDGGGRYVSILGGNGLFHHPDDRWPDAVDLEATTRWVTMLVNLATDFARE